MNGWLSFLSAKGKGLRFGVLISLSGCLAGLCEHLSGPLTVCLSCHGGDQSGAWAVASETTVSVSTLAEEDQGLQVRAGQGSSSGCM